MRLVFLPVVLLTTLSLFSQNYPVSEIPADLLENANSVVRDEISKITISDVDEMNRVYYGAYTILNKSGKNDFFPVIPYDKEVKIRSAELRVYDAKGEEIEKFKKKDFLDISAVSEVSLYSDNRALFINYIPKSYPYTLEFSYEVDSDDTAFIPDFEPIGTYNSSVQKSSFTIEVSSSLVLKNKIFDTMGIIEKSGQGGTLNFSTSHVAAIDQENQSPGFDKIAPRVLFSLNRFSLKGEIGSSENWEAFGNWMNQRLLSDVANLPESTQSEIKNLVAGVTSVKERARLVYEYMQNRTRYISVQVGLGGWKPMPASEVDRLGYGDCKGLVNYTKALLTVAEVPSYYTIVHAGSKQEDIQSDFTSIQGNHIILAVPDEEDYVWLECTNQDMPFGYIGDFTDDRNVVLITPEGGKVARTKKYEVEENRLLTEGTVVLDALGNLDVLAEIHAEGLEYDGHYMVENRKDDEKKDFFKEYWSHIDNIGFNSMHFTNDKEKVVFHETIDFIAGSYASFAGEDMLLNVNVLNRLTYIPKRYRNRQWPLQIARGYHNIDSVTIKLPENYQLAVVPKPNTLETKFGSYRSEIQKLPSGDLLYQREIKMLPGMFPKEDYKAYRDFRKKVAKFDDQKIILTKS